MHFQDGLKMTCAFSIQVRPAYGGMKTTPAFSAWIENAPLWGQEPKIIPAFSTQIENDLCVFNPDSPCLWGIENEPCLFNPD